MNQHVTASCQTALGNMAAGVHCETANQDLAINPGLGPERGKHSDPMSSLTGQQNHSQLYEDTSLKVRGLTVSNGKHSEKATLIYISDY